MKAPSLLPLFPARPRRAARSPVAWLLRGSLLLALAMLPTAPLVLLAGPRPVAADEAKAGRQRVLVLRSDGKGVTEAQQQAVGRDIVAQAQSYKQLDILSSQMDLVEEMLEFECTDAGVDCLARIGNSAKYQAQLVVYSEVGKNPSGQLQLTMRVIDVAQGRVAQSTVQPLELDKAGVAAQRGLVVLLGPPDLPTDNADNPGTVQVTLVGGGAALVYLDERLVGRTSVSGLKFSAAAGTHTLKVVRAGFKEWSGRLAVVGGALVEQTVQLEQQASVAAPVLGAPASPPTAAPTASNWKLWAAVGAGVVAAGLLGWYLLSDSSTPQLGNVAVTLDDTEAYKDPVFLGNASK